MQLMQPLNIRFLKWKKSDTQEKVILWHRVSSLLMIDGEYNDIHILIKFCIILFMHLLYIIWHCYDTIWLFVFKKIYYINFSTIWIHLIQKMLRFNVSFVLSAKLVLKEIIKVFLNSKQHFIKWYSIMVHLSIINFCWALTVRCSFSDD